MIDSVTKVSETTLYYITKIDDTVNKIDKKHRGEFDLVVRYIRMYKPVPRAPLLTLSPGAFFRHFFSFLQCIRFPSFPPSSASITQETLFFTHCYRHLSPICTAYYPV